MNWQAQYFLNMVLLTASSKNWFVFVCVRCKWKICVSKDLLMQWENALLNKRYRHSTYCRVRRWSGRKQGSAAKPSHPCVFSVPIQSQLCKLYVLYFTGLVYFVNSVTFFGYILRPCLQFRRHKMQRKLAHEYTLCVMYLWSSTSHTLEWAQAMWRQGQPNGPCHVTCQSVHLANLQRCKVYK